VLTSTKTIYPTVIETQAELTLSREPKRLFPHCRILESGNMSLAWIEMCTRDNADVKGYQGSDHYPFLGDTLTGLADMTAHAKPISYLLSINLLESILNYSNSLPENYSHYIFIFYLLT
jgi:hypothetical protein